MFRPVAIESVASRIEVAAARCEFDPDERFPGAMYEACAAGLAICLADDAGVMVVRGDPDALFVWWAHTEANGAGVPERGLTELDGCARTMGLELIRFHSSQLFWLERAPELGFRLKAVRDMVFERVVP